MARRDIGMSDDEIDRFLSTRSTAIVVGAPATGPPSGTVGHFTYDAGSVTFAIAHDDPLVACLAADARACCVVEQFPSYYDIAGVMLHGRARRREHADDGRATFSLAVEKVVSFDFSKLAPG